MHKINIFLDKVANKAQEHPIIAIIGLSALILSFFFLTVPQVFTVVKNSYDNTLGYKARLLSAINKLSSEVNIEYFKDIVGSPVFINEINNNGKKMKEYIFVNKYFYLQAMTDVIGKVLLYSITTRDPSFRPKLVLGPYSIDRKKPWVVELGRTKFIELNQFGNPTHFSLHVGAHDFFYSEEYYFGNPGNYQSFAFALNEAGYLGVEDEENSEFAIPPILDNKEKQDFHNSKITKFRENAIINTLTITAPLAFFPGPVVSFPEGEIILGPSYNQVRILPD